MVVGILAGLATCALWGLTFVAPRAVEPFSAWDLAVARYGIFGLVSLILMMHRRFRPTDLSARRRAIGLCGGLAYVAYFLCAAFAVKLAGAAIPPLVIGTMPVLLAVIANARDASLPWGRLVPPLLLIGLGVAVVNVAAIGAARSDDQCAIGLGILAATGALGTWVAYGLVNAAVMRAPDAPDGLRWTGLQGVGAGLGGLALLPLTSIGDLGGIAAADGARFLFWALLTGLAGSWLATWFWLVASRRLPLVLSAQLIVAETVFGLAYGFAFETRWPSGAEWSGAGMQLAGVCLAVRAFGRAAPARAAAPAAPGAVRRRRRAIRG